MFRRSIAIVVLVLASHILPAQEAQTPEGQRLMEIVKALANEETAGRAPGTDGIERAANYISTTFKNLGLQPAGQNSSFDDPFTMTTSAQLGANNSVIFHTKRERPGVPIEKVPAIKTSWKLGTEYQPFGFSEKGSASGRVVFVGYGLSPHGKSYNDYDGIDVKGAVVIVLRGLPKWADSDDTYKQLASLRAKATVARDRGAVAIVFVNERGDSSDVLMPFSLDRLGKGAGILCLQVRRTPCAEIFPKNVTSLFEAEKHIENTRKPKSYELPFTTAEVSVDVQYIESQTRNIIGRVPGTDPTVANEYVVVGAHYDHLGMGDENSLSGSSQPAIHHGADDNASGTAGVLELARRFAASPPRRSVVFMTFSGEEKGLVGSHHWVQSPTLPLEKVVAMINMDMIGRLKDNRLNVHGVGTSVSWPAILDSANAQTGFTISTTADGFGPSDHSSFTPKSIPVLFFFTGLHSDYHRPTDTWEKLNYDGEARILNVVERAIRQVADAPQKIAFKEGAEKPAAKSTSSGFRVTLGIIPDYSDDPQGLRISGVRDDTPAAKAGLKADDIITGFGSTTVKNIYDLTTALASANPGDVVEISYIRDGKKGKTKATLTGK